MNGGSARFVVWSPKPLTPGYGYGFQVDSGFAGPGWIGHDGGFPGVEAFVSYHPFKLPWMAEVTGRLRESSELPAVALASAKRSGAEIASGTQAACAQAATLPLRDAGVARATPKLLATSSHLHAAGAPVPVQNQRVDLRSPETNRTSELSVP